MAAQLISSIAAGDTAAKTRVVDAYLKAEPDEQTTLLNELARAADASDHCLDALLRLVDECALDRSAIRRVLIDNDQAEDAHQDVLIVIAQSIGRYRGDSAFTTWLYSVARNVAVDHLRRRKDTVALDPEAGATRAARLSSLIATRSDLSDAVNALPDPYRQAVILRDIEQRTYAEVADALSIEMNTVKSRISRGRALVAAMLSENLSDRP